MQRILCFVALEVQGYLVKWERLTWEAKGFSVASLHDKEEGMVTVISDCTEKASIAKGRRMSLRLRMRWGIVNFVNSFDRVCYPLAPMSFSTVREYEMMIDAHTHMCDSSSLEELHRFTTIITFSHCTWNE